MELNGTHDPQRRSWIPTALEGDFPIQNLPFGRFQRADGVARGGVAIGDQVLDLRAATDLGLFSGEAAQAAQAAAGPDLHPLLELGQGPASALRARVSELLKIGGPPDLRSAAEDVLVDQPSVEMLLPTRINHFSDMCVSTFHIGRFAGQDDRSQPICPPAFRTVPIGYDGRASAVVVSGTPVRRPLGVWQAGLRDGELRYGPDPFQDYELELALWIGGEANERGRPVPMGLAAARLFGVGLLNDWSSRGIQVWEDMLGPFLGKSVATTVSPWIVTAEALAPFRTVAFERPPGDPAVPKHLNDPADLREGGLDLALSAFLQPVSFPDTEVELCRTNFSHMYWTAAQMIAHHTSNGCSLAAGDLLGSGTCSGPELSQAGCLAERALLAPPTLPNGEIQRFLADGDTVILRGRAERPGFVSIGLGEAKGRLVPALPVIVSSSERPSV